MSPQFAISLARFAQQEARSRVTLFDKDEGQLAKNIVERRATQFHATSVATEGASD